jgi:thymidylate synthase
MKFKTMSEAWSFFYKYIRDKGEKVTSRIGDTRHITNISFTLTDPLQCIVYSNLRAVSPEYSAAELVWYMRGENTIEFISKYASMWKRLTDDGKTVNSAYGYLLAHKYGFNQLEHVIELLKKNPYDRRAVLHFKFPFDYPSKDVPCTVSMQFTTFQGKLNGHVYMRSNDLWFGTPYDVMYFSMLLQMVSSNTLIPLGEYTHTVGDFHIYEKHVIDKNPVALTGPEFQYDSSLQEMLENYLHNKVITDKTKYLKRLEEVQKNVEK